MAFDTGGAASGAASGAAMGTMIMPGWGTAIGGVAGGLLGAFGGKKKGGETLTLEQMMPAWQRETGQNLSNYVNKYMSAYDPTASYAGNLSAGMTGQEGAGQTLLNRYLGYNPNDGTLTPQSGTGNMFGAAQDQINKTLQGQYADPNASPFIKAMQEASNAELANQINASRAGAGARGKFFSTAAMGEEGKLRADASRALGSQVGQFIQNERQNMLNSVPQASAMDQYVNQTIPTQQLQAANTYGSLQRTLQQADLERQYNEWTRKQGAMGDVVGQAQQLYGSNPMMGINSMTSPVQTSNPTASALSSLSGMMGSGGSMSGMGGMISNFFQKQPTQSQMLGFNTAQYR